MKIYFRTNKIKKVCEKSKDAKKQHGEICANILQKRMFELYNATTLQDIEKLQKPGLHWLKGNRKHQCAVYLEHPKRLIFEPQENESKDFIEIKIIEIQEIEDYH